MSSLYYLRNRYYSPLQQRFISADPLRFGGGDVNLYAYVGNSPVDFVDPWGLVRVHKSIFTPTPTSTPSPTPTPPPTPSPSPTRTPSLEEQFNRAFEETLPEPTRTPVPAPPPKPGNEMSRVFMRLGDLSSGCRPGQLGALPCPRLDAFGPPNPNPPLPIGAPEPGATDVAAGGLDLVGALFLIGLLVARQLVWYRGARRAFRT